MLKRTTILLTLIVSLAGCSTTKPAVDNADAKRVSTAKINTQLGMAYLERHEVQRAKQKFLTAMNEAPNIPETWYSMGYFLEVTGDTKQAKEYYMKAITLAPRRGDAHNNYGTFLCRTGEYNDAIEQFMQATQDPSYLDTASAYENAGLCATKIPDRQRAIAYFKHAVEQDPTRLASINELNKLEPNNMS
jgi:type IV pilus assembly protein PilF